jgi:two-component system, chemotaxis family, sensor kinase CheA
MDEKELLKRLREAFKLESEERLKTLSTGLVDLEKIGEGDKEKRQEILEVVYREAHSLKGAARAVNLSDVEAICQSTESVLGAMKKEDLAPSAIIFDTLHDVISFIESLLERDSESGNKEQILNVLKELDNLEKGERKEIEAKESSSPEPEQKIITEDKDVSVPQTNNDQRHPARTVEKNVELSSPERTPQFSSKVKIATDKLDDLLLKTEDMISLKLTSAESVKELKHFRSIFDRWHKNWFDAEKAFRKIQKESRTDKGQDDPDINELEKFLVWNQDTIKSLHRDILTLTKTNEHNHRFLDRKIDDLLEHVKNVVMLPSSSLLETFPRMVREMARSQEKNVEFEIQGGDIEIDRRILEEIKDPLIHLLRNSIDHGLETPAERLSQQKTEKGKVQLSIKQVASNKIEIILFDDGSGIDPVKMRELAVSKGLISSEDASLLDNRMAQLLIFQSGLSAAPIITHLSGRGLGMAIVKEKVENLGGTISITSEVGKGTHFSILVPISMSTFRGTLVQVAGELFVLPCTQVDAVIQVAPEAVKTIESKATIPFKGRKLSLVNLADILGLSRRAAPKDQKKLQVIVLSGPDGKRMGFEIDTVHGEQEVLVKNLGKQLKRVRNIAGATILGSGQIVLILSDKDLFKSAVHSTGTTLQPAIEEEKAKSRKSILVVEDSITSRTLLKSILEASGFIVKTAVDGIEGYTLLKTADIDLVVSDIEMPRMNGFELTEKIRAEPSLSSLPLILCSSLASKEDRERGIKVGANAYIIKGEFDQSNLLEVIERLI